jgi:hypothetical protein
LLLELDVLLLLLLLLLFVLDCAAQSEASRSAESEERRERRMAVSGERESVVVGVVVVVVAVVVVVGKQALRPPAACWRWLAVAERVALSPLPAPFCGRRRAAPRHASRGGVGPSRALARSPAPFQERGA